MNRKILGKFLALFTAISMLAAALPIVGAAEEQLYSAPNGNTIAELVSGGLWTYEYAKAGTTDFNAMETGSGGVHYKSPSYSGTNDSARVEDVWNNKTLYLIPGYEDAVMTFIAPGNGKITLPSSVATRHYGQNDDSGDVLQTAEIAIYKNTSKIWPESGVYSLSNVNNNTATIPEITDITVKKGDKIRFVVGVGAQAYWNDLTYWPATVKYEETGGEPTGVVEEYSAPTGENIAESVASGIWKYRYSNAKTADFYDMEAGSDGVHYKSPTYSGKFDSARIEDLWGNKVLYLIPGYEDAAITFVSPYNGTAVINAATVTRHYAENDGSGGAQNADIAIFRNGTKIWPEDGWYTLSDTNGNTAAVPEITGIKLKKGDTLNFTVSMADGAYWNDFMRWDPSLSLAVEEEVETGLEIPEVSDGCGMNINSDYSVTLKTDSMKTAETINAYNVKIRETKSSGVIYRDDSDTKSSPMISFGMSKPVTVSISADNITQAEILPESAGITPTVNGNKVEFVITEPENIAVRINGERFEMIYIFADSIKTDKNTDDNTVYYGAGAKLLPKVGTSGWDGAINDVKIYETALSGEQAAMLANGAEVSGYTKYWKLDGTDNTTDINNQLSTNTVGKPEVSSAYGAAYNGASESAMTFNGFEDGQPTGYINPANNFTVSAWVYLDADAAEKTHTIIKDILYVRPDGTVCSDAGDWEFPYVSSNKLESGKWSNVTLTVGSDGTVEVYIDGVSGGTEKRANYNKVYLNIGTSGLINGMYVRDGQTVYLDYGAVIKGTVIFSGVKNAALKGNGIINAARIEENLPIYNGVQVIYSDNITVEGVTVNNSESFAYLIGQSENITLNNIKAFTCYGASDGVHIKASENVNLFNSFLRTLDDCVAVNCSSANYLGESRNINIRGNVFANDGAHSVLIGAHVSRTHEETVSGVCVSDNDIIESRSHHPVYPGIFAINVGDNGTASDIAYINNRIGDIENNMMFDFRIVNNPSYHTEYGKAIKNVLIADISYNGENGSLNTSNIIGNSETRAVTGISVYNVTANGAEHVIPFGEFAEGAQEYVTGTVNGDFITDGETLVKYIGNDENVTLPDGITKIGKAAFANNYMLKNVEGLENVTAIEDGAFANCVSLESAGLLKNTAYIGKFAFYGCDALSTVAVPAGALTYEAGYVFAACPNLTAYVFESDYAREYAAANGIAYKIIGDMNSDGAVNILDLIRSKKSAASSEYSISGDMDLDGEIRSDDLVLLRRYIILK